LDASGNRLGVGQAEIDRILAGPADLRLVVNERDGRLRLETLNLTNPQVTVGAAGVIDGDTRRIELSARLADLAILAPGFPGPLTASGTVTETVLGYEVDLTGDGPGATNAQVKG